MGACGTKLKRIEIRNIMPYKVQVSAIIWPKNQHNLFDFESTAYALRDLEVDFSCQLICIEKDLAALCKGERAKGGVELLNIGFQDDHAEIYPVSLAQDHKLWAVIKHEGNLQSLEHWDLKLNDVLKLGRVRMQLVEYAFMNQEEELTQELEPEEEAISMREGTQCRICLSTKATESNPLISPCHCGGSVKYVHLDCLQRWIAIQLKIKQGDHFIQYVYKRLECEICKFVFCNTYTYGDKKYDVIKIPKPRSSYMTFRVTNDDKSKDGMIFVVEIGNKTELKIGRVPDCDIKLRDISVSRSHASIRLIKTPNYTEEQPDYTMRVIDHKSKFGTLILAQDQELLKIPMAESKILFQTGKVLLWFEGKKKTNNKTIYRHPDNLQIYQAEAPCFDDIVSLQDQNELQDNDIIFQQ